MIFEKDLAFLDIESTGPDPTKDKIVEISIIICSKEPPYNEILKKTRLINPKMKISEEATEVHGITNADVYTQDTFPEVADSLHDLLKDCALLAYNGWNFDFQMLKEEFQRCEIDYPNEKTIMIDPYVIFREREKRDLAAALMFYTGKELEGAHRADADTEALKEVFFGQRMYYEELADYNIDQLMLEGSDWKGADFAGWFYKNEEDGDFYFAKGKNVDKKVRDNKGYCDWMMKNSFPLDTKLWIGKILSGAAYN